LRGGVSGRVSLVFGAGAPLGTPFSRYAGPLHPSTHSRRWNLWAKVGHAYLDPGTCDADGADGQPHAVLLSGERALDSGALCIGSGDVPGQRPSRHALLVDVALEHAPPEERLVLLRALGGVGPYARAGVLLANELRQPCPVMGVGSTGIPGADQLMRPVDADMVFVAEYRDREIDRL